MAEAGFQRGFVLAAFNKRFGRVSLFWHWVARSYAWILGWKVTGTLPDDPKMIGIIAPHTSSWDVVWMYVMADTFRIKANWLAKESLLRPPIGWLLRPLGAIPVVRTEHRNVTDSVAATIAEYDHLYLAIAPEGTRHRAPYWRTGFYHIALKAKLRIIFMYIDYKKKEVGFGPVLTPTGDIEADFKIIRDFYQGVTPRHPSCFGPIEIQPSDAAGARP